MGTGLPGVRTIQAVHVGLTVRNAVGPVNRTRRLSIGVGVGSCRTTIQM